MIFSFYSFKGGVGRTQLLANLASYLCYYWDYKILIIDWDMEAPGCHLFFTDDYQTANFNKEGILETMQAYCRLIEEKGDTALPEERLYFTKENVYQLKKSQSGKGAIDLITAGKYSKGFDFYTEAGNFNWLKFHQEQGGKNYLEFIKKQLKNKEIGFDYDFIFIDSRTGINDYTNLVNIQMSECDVLVMAPNAQNFAGCKLVADRILASEYVTSGEYRKPFILPILSRFAEESEERNKWLNEFVKLFAPLLPTFAKGEIKEKDIKTVFNDEFLFNTKLNHIQVMGEPMFFSPEKPPINKNDTLVYNFANIAHYLIEIKDAGGVEFGKKKKQENEEVKNNKPTSKAEAYLNMGNSFVFLGKYEEAKEQYEKAIVIEPNFYIAWNNLGNVYVDLKDYYKAIETYQKAIAIKPDYHDVWYNLGNAYNDLGNYFKTIEAYEKAVKIKEDYHQAWNNLGNVYIKLGNYSEATKAYLKSITIKPDEFITLDNLGLVYSKLQEYTKAQECFEKAININPKYEPAIFNLACLHSLQQNKPQALAYLQQAIEISPEEIKQKAKKDKDFEWLWGDADFQALVGE